MFGVVANIENCDTVARMAAEYSSVDIKGMRVIYMVVSLYQYIPLSTFVEPTQTIQMNRFVAHFT